MKHYLEFTKAWRWENGVEEIFNSSNDIMYHEYQTCGLSYVGQLIHYHEPITLPIASPASSLQPYYWNEDEKWASTVGEWYHAQWCPYACKRLFFKMYLTGVVAKPVK